MRRQAFPIGVQHVPVLIRICRRLTRPVEETYILGKCPTIDTEKEVIKRFEDTANLRTKHVQELKVEKYFSLLKNSFRNPLAPTRLQGGRSLSSLSGSIGHTYASLLTISMPSSRMVRKLIFAVETLLTSWLWACKLPLLAMDPHMALSIGEAVERATTR